jgi:ribosomal RNA methyltransferase Nop2
VSYLCVLSGAQILEDWGSDTSEVLGADDAFDEGSSEEEGEVIHGDSSGGGSETDEDHEEEQDEDAEDHGDEAAEEGVGGRERIEHLVDLLMSFKERRPQNVSRADLVDKLGGLLSDHFGYLPELTDMFLSMFSPAECLEFMDASDKPRPLVIRTNTLKSRRKELAQALIKRGVNLEPLAPWSKVALKIIDSQVKATLNKVV